MYRKHESNIIKWMVEFYCSEVHGGEKICGKCDELLRYAIERGERCPHGGHKPVCSNCEIHCYSRVYRGQIRDVMRFSGPKIFFHRPLYGIRYILRKKFGGKGKKIKPS